MQWLDGKPIFCHIRGFRTSQGMDMVHDKTQRYGQGFGMRPDQLGFRPVLIGAFIHSIDTCV